jgi:hypothetical protein
MYWIGPKICRGTRGGTIIFGGACATPGPPLVTCLMPTSVEELKKNSGRGDAILNYL